MSNWGTQNTFSKLALASGLALLASCNGGLIGDIADAPSRARSEVCTPDCAGNECGDDGCGGSCGDCIGAELCNGLGACYDPKDCSPDCADRECGDDACGGSCGDCIGGDLCDTLGTCYEPITCTPDCGAKDCGSDGCQGSCGTCAGGDLCDALGACYDPNQCAPDCAGMECGSDGCGGSCGTCTGGDLCDGQGTCYEPITCTPNCAGMECGGDGCGGSCGSCTGGNLCDGQGTCYQPEACTPDCAGKECGGDGCGGSCGSCPASDVCQANTCTSPPAVTVFFKDKIQTKGEPWGFDEALTEYPVGDFLPSGSRSDAKANLTKVADPAAGGSGWAIRQAVHANGPGGGRSELGVWTLGGLHSALRTHLRTGASIFMSMEMYLPEHTQPATPDSVPWLAMYDIHPTTNTGGVWRPGWTASWPEDGSDSLLVGRKDKDEETYSNVQMPIGEWFTLEIEWSGGANETVRTWVNGTLATTQHNVQTTPSGNIINEFEAYIKVYTEPQGSPWVADPVIKYVRNYQITDQPRFH